MSRKKDIVKPFEFSLKINDNIICQRYFIVKNYNDDSRESLEIKEMMDDIMGMNQHIQLGLIPEFFKYLCLRNSDKPYYSQNNHLTNKEDIFKLEVSKNNVNQIRNEDGDFNFDDLQKEVMVIGMFDGTVFHPNVRYEINIRGIIPDIIRTIQKHLSMREYTKSYDSVELSRNNRLSYQDKVKIGEY